MQAAKKGQYTTTSCPICFNDFDTSATTKSEAAQPQQSLDGASTSAAATAQSQQQSSAKAGNDGERAALLGNNVSADAAASSSGDDDGSGSGAGQGGVQPFMLPCGHTFCEPCIDKWLQRNAKCPGAPCHVWG